MFLVTSSYSVSEREKNLEKDSFPSSFFAAWTSGEIARLLEILLNTQIRTSPTVSHEESHKHQWPYRYLHSGGVGEITRLLNCSVWNYCPLYPYATKLPGAPLTLWIRAKKFVILRSKLLCTNYGRSESEIILLVWPNGQSSYPNQIILFFREPHAHLDMSHFPASLPFHHP